MTDSIAQDSEVKVEGALFKHEETTKTITMRFKNDRGSWCYPDRRHKYIAKIANSQGYLGDYPVMVTGTTINLKTADLAKLVPDDYTLEVWESYSDRNGATQTTIYPSPGYRVKFRVESNITEASGEMIKQIGFQEVVNSAVAATGHSVKIGSVKAGEAGSQPQVTETYQDGQNIFDFVIPAGQKGDKGDVGPAGTPGRPGADGKAATITIGTVTNGTEARVTNSGDTSNAVFNFTLPAGERGPQGIQGETGKTGATGAPGQNGQDAKLTMGNVKTLEPGQPATATLTNTGNNTYRLDLNLPAGPKGETGGVNQIVKAELSIGSITTAPAGESASASLTKTSESSYALNLSIPTGPKGEAGATGQPGPTGQPGKDGKDGVTPHVDDSTGNWFVGSVNTGIHAQGPRGDAGAPGATGKTGVDGVTPHIDKLTGNWFLGTTNTGVHAQGDTGAPGPAGKDGKDGAAGQSAYQLWLASGNSGSMNDFLNALKGPKGDTGATGAPGQAGVSGKDGAPGKDGKDGVLKVLQIGENTDLNTLMDTALYLNKGYDFKNGPSDLSSGWFSMVALGFDTKTNGTQILFDANANEAWQRRWHDGNTWTDWKNFDPTTNIETINSIKAPNTYDDGVTVQSIFTSDTGIDWSKYGITTSDFVLLKTDCYNGSAQQTLEYSSGETPVRLIRSGTGNTWHDWKQITLS